MPPQLSRLAMIFAGLIAAFIIVRWVARPDSFYQYGHYRGKALYEITAQSPNYVPCATCAGCHEAEAAQSAAGPHATVACQTCHGPGREHVSDPDINNIARPRAEVLCLRCHEQNTARPVEFPQIVSEEHAGGESCRACHQLHNPRKTP